LHSILQVPAQPLLLARRVFQRDHVRAKSEGARVLDDEPIRLRRLSPDPAERSLTPQSIQPRVAFNRHELSQILTVYGRQVATGEWRDYAIDFLRDRAIFSIFRRASEVPIYRVEKNPALARRQGAYSVVTATGLILKRGHDLNRVLAVLDRKLQIVG
jgi:hypothetical protein